MKRGMILGVVVFYLFFVCFWFFFFVAFRGLSISHVRLLRLYFASDTLFLVVTFHLGFLLSLPCISLSRWSFSSFRFLLLLLTASVRRALVPMHTVGGNKLFCFSFNEHILSKVELYTIFRCTFFSFPYDIQHKATLLSAFGWSVFA